MKNRKSLVVIILVILVATIFILPKLGLFSVSEFTDVWLTQNSEGLYHYAINAPMEGSCRWTETIVTDNHYNFNKESKIKIGNSEFKFVVNNIFRPERSAGNQCAVILYDIDVYMNDVKIDTISSSWAVNDIHSRDDCILPCGGSVIYRAYDTNGKVYKESNQDFSICSQKITLPSLKPGIEVEFGIKKWLDGAMTSCRQLHLINKIDPVLKNDVYPIIGQLFTIKIEDNSKIQSGEANINLNITNQYTTSHGEYGLLLDSGVGLPINIYSKTTELSRNNLFNIRFNTTSTSLKLIPYLKIYEPTSNLLNLNGVKIFSDQNIYIQSSDHQYYLLGNYNGNIVTINQQQTCNTPADTNCDTKVLFEELITYANSWASGSVTFSNLIQAANAWAGGS